MVTVRTDKFRKDAVRIALTSVLSRRQIADYLGGGMSTLSKWITAHHDTDVVSVEDRELALENERLRREVSQVRTARHQQPLRAPTRLLSFFKSLDFNPCVEWTNRLLRGS